MCEKKDYRAQSPYCLKNSLMDFLSKGDNSCDEKDLIMMDHLFALPKMCTDQMEIKTQS